MSNTITGCCHSKDGRTIRNFVLRHRAHASKKVPNLMCDTFFSFTVVSTQHFDEI